MLCVHFHKPQTTCHQSPVTISDADCSCDMLQGLGRAEKHATYMKTLRQLIWWCILIAIICTAFLLLLISTPSWIDPTYTLGKVSLTSSTVSVAYIF